MNLWRLPLLPPPLMGGGEEGGEGEKGHYCYARGDEFVIEKVQGGVRGGDAYAVRRG